MKDLKMFKYIVYFILLGNIIYARPLYTFGNISVNHLNWSKSTQEKTNHKDFNYLEIEGGAGYNWGEFYGFIDIENPSKNYTNETSENLRYIIKPIFDINIANNFAFHIQDYYFKSKNFYVNNLIYGISYKYSSSNFWFRPAIGLHYQDSTYYSGENGYMLRWALNYDFTIKGNKLSISQWHEMELDRKKEHYQFSDGNKNGTNGALSFWWHINKKFSTGIQYRYADHKLGYNSYQHAYIYSLKYNF